jgi:hypothetical protein
VLTDEESEETDELVESSVQSSLSSEDEDNTEETEVTFRDRRARDSSNIFDFTGAPNGVNRSAASDINAESLPFSVFLLFFGQIFQIVSDETNHYFHQYMASKNTESTSAHSPDITIEEINTFFALVIQMGRDQHASLKDYWSREEQYCTPSCCNVTARDRFFHVLRFHHFENRDDPPNSDDPDCDRLWEIRTVFDTPSNNVVQRTV